jgi:hypothetical protein
MTTSTPLKYNAAPKIDYGRPSTYFDAEGRFIHNCEICGAPAYQGRNVNLLQGQLGTWRCQQHLWECQTSGSRRARKAI